MTDLKKDSQSRAWVITQRAEDYTEKELKDILQNYVYIAKKEKGEKGGEQGYEHYQIYIENIGPIKFSTLKKKLPNAHIEERKGTRQQAYDYVVKAETSIGEPFGNGEINLVEEQGKRNDLNNIIMLLEEGASMAEIRTAFPSQFLMYQGRIKSYLDSMRENEYNNKLRELEVTYIFGSAGTGKTRYVMEKYGFQNVYRVTDYVNPFDMYNGQDVLLFEEFRSDIPIGKMLNYLDIYPLQLPARFSNKQACFTKIYITTNIPLEKQYTTVQVEYPETWQAFIRRIHNIWHLGKWAQPKPLKECLLSKLTLVDTGELIFK